jgi:hypothetical protein
MRVAVLAASLYAICFAQPVLADNPASPVAPSSQRIKGKIETYDPASRTLSVTTSGKKTVSITLEPDLRVIYDAKRTLNDIKAGDFIGSATIRSADGKLRAQEVHIFPDSMRGAGEGQYATNDANPNRAMTNATVAQVTSVAANKGSITLSYRGGAPAADGSCTGRAGSGTGCTGEAEIQIVPGVPIIALVVGDESLLVPGAAVSISAVSAAGGGLASSRLTVEKDGVRPIL